ncbi:hypothetical protein IPJ91_03150 [bacterium]|nr:MAG: hypothetical protein IPJ91_03150 [bacterium]
MYPVDPVNGNDFSGQAAIVIFGIAIAPVVIVAAVVIGGVYLTQTTHGKQMVRTTGQLIDSSVRSISNAISNTNAAATTATGTAGVAKSIGDGCNILKSCNTKKNNSQQRSGVNIGSNSGSSEGYTQSSLQRGQQMHLEYKVGLNNPDAGLYKEYRGIQGIRPDFVDFNTRTIFELKPNNPWSITRGINQLNNYQSIFEAQTGSEWNTVLDLY